MAQVMRVKVNRVSFPFFFALLVSDIPTAHVFFMLRMRGLDSRQSIMVSSRFPCFVVFWHRSFLHQCFALYANVFRGRTLYSSVWALTPSPVEVRAPKDS